jgi:triacylglycerol lipase
MNLPRGFNKQLAMELGNLVVHAYNQFESFEDEKEWVLPEPYELLHDFKYEMKSDSLIGSKINSYDTSIRKFLKLKEKASVLVPIGFIAKREKTVFVIFRGTKTPKEWVDNLNISFKEYVIPSFGNIHEGFLQVYKTIQNTLYQCINDINPKDALYISGHSLGAALATLAAPDIEINVKKRISALYTFGSPRVGDDSFVKSFNEKYSMKSYRIVNTSDVVTSIPLPVPILGSLGGYFSHVDTPIDFTVQENDIVKNHEMKTYLAEIENAKTEHRLFHYLFR